MIYVICGPTGSGKTDVALKVADLLDAPIVNADAFQIYKDMNIGTNKLSVDSPYYKRHYLLDIKTPEETYSVRDYQIDFRRVVDELSKSYKDIVVCGGTGLYIKAAIYDYQFLDEEESEPQENYDGYTNEKLYEKLISLDKEAAQNIHVNNRKRIIRALDLISRNGVKKSDVINSQEHLPLYEAKFLFLNPDRDKLYEAINARVDSMIASGLVEEVKMLKAKYNLSLTSKQAIGYKEILDYLDNKTSLLEAIELIKKRTRNYAKRQVTFFKNQFKTELFSAKEALFDWVKEYVGR